MKQRHLNKNEIHPLRPDPALALLRNHSRMYQAIHAMERPLLLLGLPEELLLELLGQGLQADICGDSLDRLESLAKACLDLGLRAKLYWQSLPRLDLPERYRSILLAPSVYQHLISYQDAQQIQQQLQQQLEPGGEIGLLLN